MKPRERPRRDRKERLPLLPERPREQRRGERRERALAPGGSSSPPAAREADRVERAVAFLNARARAIAQEILTIGRYPLREFFDDDAEAVANRDRDKMNSLRDLAARDDLLLSYSTLWRAVNVALQERRLGLLPALERLSASHRIDLLAVDDLDRKRELATRADEEGWSARKLKQEIRDPGEDASGRAVRRERRKRAGRDTIWMIEMSLRQLAGAKVRHALAPPALAALPPARAERVAGLLRDPIASLREILGAIEKTRGT